MVGLWLVVLGLVGCFGLLFIVDCCLFLLRGLLLFVLVWRFGWLVIVLVLFGFVWFGGLFYYFCWW